MTSDRLDSWKEIAAYLRRSVRTVTRWEREEGLPVHRHLHSKSGTVYAYKPELDAWWTSRGKQLDSEPSEAHPKWPLWSDAQGLLRLWLCSCSAGSSGSPLCGARRHRLRDSLPLTTYPGVEGPPSLSPDGNQVAFERNGDIFVKQVDSEALAQLTRTAEPEQAPAWSPDGRWIAFSRGRDGIFVISPLGGGERKVADTRAAVLLKTMAWTSDSSSLVVSELTSSICASLFVISIETGQKTRLTWPPEPSIGDGWPAISPDGRIVAFARYSQDTSANIHIAPITGGEPRQVTADKASIFGLAWTPDGELVFSSDRDGAFRLWRVAAKRLPDAPVAALDIAGENVRFPSISARWGGYTSRLAYQRLVEDLDIRRGEIVGEATPEHRLRSSQPFISSTSSEDHPRYSPDGTKIAFVSRRSGTQEIWVCRVTHRIPCV